jgi:hypothetical protein
MSISNVVPRAILPNGRFIPPDTYTGGYYGTSKTSPTDAFREGFPARGDDMRLREHTEDRGNSAFRGTTPFPIDQSGEYGAACWAGEGGWVYEIRHVPTWDLDRDLQGQVPLELQMGFRGNLMRAEQEGAILACVPPDHIKRAGQVEDRHGHLCVTHWTANPNYAFHQVDGSPS